MIEIFCIDLLIVGLSVVFVYDSIMVFYLVIVGLLLVSSVGLIIEDWYYFSKWFSSKFDLFN